MGPAESLLAITSGYYKRLKRDGLNPFDLLSWDALSNLWTEIVHSGRLGNFTDRKIHQLTKEMVWAALERKAEAYQMEDGDESYIDTLEALKCL